MTPSQAKNALRRAVTDLMLPPLTKREKDEIWQYFGSLCAYCNGTLQRDLRHGHMDHLDPKRGNEKRNRVLACGSCNGDQKRERDWKCFLRSKSSGEEYRSRLDKIEKWAAWESRPHLSKRILNKQAFEKINKLREILISDIDGKISKIREIVRDPNSWDSN